MHNKLTKKLSAFSLLEVMVSMAIIGIIMAMLSNILVNSVVISQKSIARSFVREELTDIIDRIAADVRDANSISSCSGSLQTARCDLVLDAPVTWKTCVNSNGGYDVCKLDANGNVLFTSSPTLKLTTFSFDQGYDTGTNSIRKNILITIVADHQNAATGVKNILRQTSVSTRNYELINPGSLVGGAPIVGAKTFGTGSDGALDVTGLYNIQVSSNGSRVYPDGIAYRINPPLAGATSATRYAATYSLNSGISAGDSVLVINLRGYSDRADVGNYEIMSVQSITADTITFASALQKNYYETDAARQVVMVQRIPNYTDVTIESGGQLLASGWAHGNPPAAPAAGGSARYNHISEVYGGQIFSTSGCNSACYVNTMDIYDEDSNTWSTGTASATASRFLAASTLYNGQIYIWGGYNGSYLNTMTIYNIAGNNWLAGVNGGTGRRGLNAAQYNGKMYLWGGQIAGNSVVNTMDIFDIPSGTWTTGTAGGTPRVFYQSVVYNGKLYIWGGCSYSSCAVIYNTMDIFDFATNTWSTGATGGIARYAAGNIENNGKIYFLGGCLDSVGTVTNSVSIYDIESNSWSAGIGGGTARCGVTAVEDNDLIYVLGGRRGTTNYYNLLDVFDINSGLWNAGNGYGTGIVAFKASGNITVNSGGKILTQYGYTAHSNTYQGESTSGLGSAGTYLRRPEGGGGGSYQYPNCPNHGGAGGGGYGSNGGTGVHYFCSGIGDSTGGQGGLAYGYADLMTQIFLGSAGGSGNIVTGSEGAGGRGGGILMMWGRNISIQGTITASGGNAQANPDASGGGGGSGGSIFIAGVDIDVGTTLVTSVGGAGGTGKYALNGGHGGLGRIAIYYNSTVTGTTNPAAYTVQFTPD